MQNGIEESQSRQRSTDGIEECLYQLKGVETGWVRSVECIVGASAGIENLPSQAEERRKGGMECGMG